jgi:hypothetical protein
MATVVHETHYNRRITDRGRPFGAYAALLGAQGLKVSWGGIWSGVLLAVGLLLLLAALGAAIGISAVQPGESDASTFAKGAGIYAAISLLIALFVGGWASTRLGAISDRATSLCEGALVWVVSVLLMGFLAASGVASVAGGAFKLVGGTAQAMGPVMQGQGEQAAQSGQRAAQDARQKIEDAKSSGALQQKAEEAKPAATKAAWITLGALLLSLVAAVAGATAGRRETDAAPTT